MFNNIGALATHLKAQTIVSTRVLSRTFPEDILQIVRIFGHKKTNDISELATRLCHVHTLNVVHWYASPYFSADADAIPKLVKQAHEEKLATLLADYDVTPEQVYLQAGENDKVLTELVSTVHASMVIMGALSHDFLERVIIGSTAERILDRLPCDILVIKPDGFVSPVTL